MIVCTRAGKSQWVPVTDVTTHSEKLSKQLQKSGQEPEDISAEVNIRLQTLAYKKSRRKTSTKCGCKWSVRFTTPAPGDKNSVIRVSKSRRSQPTPVQTRQDTIDGRLLC